MSCVRTCGSNEKTEVNLVEQILEQGQRLRNSMVQTILNNDPFYNTILPDKFHTIDGGQEGEKEISTAQKHKFIAYLRGDSMTREEERQVLETFREMSTVDICEVTERSYSNIQNACNCETCSVYSKRIKNYDGVIPPLNLKSVTNVNSTSDFVNINNHPIYSLKHIDSLKISVHSLRLNQEGNLKVSRSIVDKQKVPQSLNTTFFIEYEIPGCIARNVRKKSKVDSGLENSNAVKLCSKKLHKEAIYFKQISIHDIQNLESSNLDAIDITFKISSRTFKQKEKNILGYAIFNMGSFKETKYLSCNQELVIFIKKGTPLIIGSLKVNMQLGCGRIYFGKEFCDSLHGDKTNNILPEIISYDKTDSSISPDSEKTEYHIPNIIKDDLPKVKKKVIERNKKVESSRKETDSKIVKKVIIPENEDKKDAETKMDTKIIEKQILFGFILISEVQYLENKEYTYFTCEPFCQNDSIYSNVTKTGLTSVFNFFQTIPIIYNEDFIGRLRDNYMIFEFWEKTENGNYLIGVCSIPLHQYYLAFRNPVILKYLDRNKLPVIGTDWYEPISDPNSGVLQGQAQILVALGSQEQIRNLQNERGFKDNLVTKSKRNFCKTNPSFECLKEKTAKQTKFIIQKEQINETKTSLCIDKGSQVDLEITKEIVKVPTKTYSNKSFQTIEKMDKASQSDAIEIEKKLPSPKQDLLTPLLQQFLTQKMAPIHVDTGTNTEMNLNKEESTKYLRKTTDLLDTLQKALSSEKKTTAFKAHIVVESALHLPSRKKCVPKKVKGKMVRERILPSTYVTFEDNDGELKISQIVHKCTSPKWDFRCDVSLPVNLLINVSIKQKYTEKDTSPKWDFRCDVSLPVNLLVNNQKRLIFKVWKKSNITPQMQPNVQIDSVVGFAALDLTVLLVGLPTVQGWFNIMDFSGKCNGQIKINVTPLENILKYNEHKYNENINNTNKIIQTNNILQQEEPGELLNRALKRKFIELDEITQRLRSRLNHVTNDESDNSNDDIADEFENDINTLCVEDDYDMIDFEKEAQKLNFQRVSDSLMKWQGTNMPDNQTLMLCPDNESLKICTFDSTNKIEKEGSHVSLLQTTSNHFEDDMRCTTASSCTQINSDLLDDNSESGNTSSAASVTALDKQLVEGKQRIDTLLQQLSLASKTKSETFLNRYVSGCSVSQDITTADNSQVLELVEKKDLNEAEILQELGIEEEFDANRLFDATLQCEFRAIGVTDALEKSGNHERAAPDGEGNNSEDDHTPVVNL